MNIIVSIGRNVDDEPMAEHLWDAFRDLVFMAVDDACKAIFFHGDGAGEYEGQGEDAYTVIGEVSDTSDVFVLRRLARIGNVFGQECVAVTFGKPSFVDKSCI